MRRVAVLGASGFLGTRIVHALEQQLDAQIIVLPKLDEETDEAAFVRLLDRVDVVLNSAGAARPASQDRQYLRALNVDLASRMWAMAEQAGVRHFVHVSSAAVQGRSRIWDESCNFAPASPYAESKVAAEEALLDRNAMSQMHLSVYRPTSVQGQGRNLTQSLVRFARFPGSFVIGTGDERLPLAHVDNVANAAAHICMADDLRTILLHPWEGVTQALFYKLYGGGREPVRTGVNMHRVLERMVSMIDRRSGRFAHWQQRFDLLVFGKAQQADSLLEIGFVVPPSQQLHRMLADEVWAARPASGSR